MSDGMWNPVEQCSSVDSYRHVRRRDIGEKMEDNCGYIEYSFELPEVALVDISVTVEFYNFNGMQLFLNGELVDRHMLNRCTSVDCSDSDTRQKKRVYSETGPHVAKAGHNVIRFESNA